MLFRSGSHIAPHSVTPNLSTEHRPTGHRLQPTAVAGVQIDMPEMGRAPRSQGGPSGSCRAGRSVATRRAQEVSGCDGVPPNGAPTQLTASTIAKYGLVITAKVPAREVAMTGVAITAVTVDAPDPSRSTKSTTPHPHR